MAAVASSAYSPEETTFCRKFMQDLQSYLKEGLTAKLDSVYFGSFRNKEDAEALLFQINELSARGYYNYQAAHIIYDLCMRFLTFRTDFECSSFCHNIKRLITPMRQRFDELLDDIFEKTKLYMPANPKEAAATVSKHLMMKKPLLVDLCDEDEEEVKAKKCGSQKNTVPLDEDESLKPAEAKKTESDETEQVIKRKPEPEPEPERETLDDDDDSDGYESYSSSSEDYGSEDDGDEPTEILHEGEKKIVFRFCKARIEVYRDGKRKMYSMDPVTPLKSRKHVEKKESDDEEEEECPATQPLPGYDEEIPPEEPEKKDEEPPAKKPRFDDAPKAA